MQGASAHKLQARTTGSAIGTYVRSNPVTFPQGTRERELFDKIKEERRDYSEQNRECQSGFPVRRCAGRSKTAIRASNDARGGMASVERNRGNGLKFQPVSLARDFARNRASSGGRFASIG